MTFLFYLSVVVFMVLAAMVSLVILVQESKSLGLGASFGGDPGESLFGTSTAAVLKTITVWLAVLFIVGCVCLSMWSAAIGRQRVESLPASMEEYT